MNTDSRPLLRCFLLSALLDPFLGSLDIRIPGQLNFHVFGIFLLFLFLQHIALFLNSGGVLLPEHMQIMNALQLVGEHGRIGSSC